MFAALAWFAATSAAKARTDVPAIRAQLEALSASLSAVRGEIATHVDNQVAALVERIELVSVAAQSANETATSAKRIASRREARKKPTSAAVDHDAPEPVATVPRFVPGASTGFMTGMQDAPPPTANGKASTPDIAGIEDA